MRDKEIGKEGRRRGEREREKWMGSEREIQKEEPEVR